MTKVRLCHSHNGERPPTERTASLGLRTTSSINRSQLLQATRTKKKSSYHLSSATTRLVFITSFLICFAARSLSAAQSPRQQPVAQHSSGSIHDSISDSSISSQGATTAAVSNLSVRSQQLQLRQPAQQQPRWRPTLQQLPNGGQQANEYKNNLSNRRLLVERDLSSLSSPRPNGASGLSARTDSDLPVERMPANHNNNNDADTSGEVNGEEAGDSGDESALDYSEASGNLDSSTEITPQDLPAPESHARPSRQSFDVTTRRPVTEATTGQSRAGLLPQTTTPTTTEATTFNVHMGSDRLLIKPHRQPQATTVATPTVTSTPRRTTPQPIATTTTSRQQQVNNRLDQEPRASESVQHEFITTTRNPYPFSGNSNERLLYPASSTNIDRPATTFMPRMGYFGGGNHQSSEHEGDLLALQQQQQLQQATFCYTPFALILVVLMTMLTTLVVCLCTHFLFKHYARRNQFDLVATSRQFDTKHSDHTGASWPAQHQQQQHLATSKNNSTSSNNNLLRGLFASETAHLGAGRRDDEFAFDNPYFRDEQLRLRQQQAQQQQAQAAMVAEAPPGGQASDQMNFIQHHISNLHARQVTSSVKELSALSGARNNNNQATQRDQQLDCCGGDQQAAAATAASQQVVDLTSLEHRNRIIANPKEGDLIAVDITGHDFIGLGFDVCGSQHEGIFVRSLLSRGPARESGCIEVGDRIKCLNVAFDNISLQDARDILNCGAPYKMRILLEKQPASKTRSRLHGNLTEQQQQRQPLGACLRKLGNQLMGRSSTADGQLSGIVNNSYEQQGEWLGSVAARQQRALTSAFAPAPTSTQGYLNQAFGASENELSQQHKRADTIDSACSVNMRSSIEDAGRGMRRYSSSQQPLSERADSSLEHFHTQNANHRLHGPSGTDNLHLAMEPTLMDTESEDDHEGGREEERSRRRRRANHMDGGSHLEQTQSQPDIAPRSGSSQAHKVPEAGDARFDIDVHDNDDQDEALQRRQHHKLSSSISTPTINLMPLTTSPGGGLDRRMSSRRRPRKDESRSTINEEPAIASQT